MRKSWKPGQEGGLSIDRSLTQTLNLNNNKFNHKHCHVFYCKQLACGEMLTVLYC